MEWTGTLVEFRHSNNDCDCFNSYGCRLEQHMFFIRQWRPDTSSQPIGRQEWLASVFELRKHPLLDWIKDVESCNRHCCPASRFSKMSLEMSWKIIYREWTPNPQSRGFKEDLRGHFSPSQPVFQRWQAYTLCRRSDAAMLSCHLCMHGWLLRKQSPELDQAAPLPCVRSTVIVICSSEFIIVVIGRLSAILPTDDTHDWGRWEGETKCIPIGGRSSRWNLWSPHLEYQMHLPDN